MLTMEEIFPPFGLRITGGPVEMRVLRDEDIPELVELIRGGVQSAGVPMPFLHDWHAQPLAPGSPEGFPTASLAWWWSQRAKFAPEDWHMALTVRREGLLVGMQDIHAMNFPQTRHVETGSWLGLSHQGRGTGTLMRKLVVGFAFDERRPIVRLRLHRRQPRIGRGQPEDRLRREWAQSHRAAHRRGNKGHG